MGVLGKIMENIGGFLSNAPTNWGRWGKEDEIGALNFLGNAEVLRGISTIKDGSVFTLGQLIRDPEGDLLGTERRPTGYHMLLDEIGNSGGVDYADDLMYIYTHGTTHIDALGHVWYDDQSYNGHEKPTGTGGLPRNGIHLAAKKGIVGRAVLLDVARYKGVDWIREGAEITLEDLLNTAAHQNVTLNKHDILLVRTGFYLNFVKNGYHAYFQNGLKEPGITYTDELVRWFYDQEIPVYGTDTLGSEQTVSSQTGTVFPLHPYFLTRLGLSIVETLWLEELASACAQDGRYDFCLMISPLKLVGGTASPINPIAIR
ncbi:cyclase family protein [Fictibacillus enclensis]|uniref:cyclase family protein n=1 Tax=Fictibacillus enclensis TaxID=1017270 RepID=UPI0025A124B1|nr:cyclase family protein [Fictibacillus enclensis]MDM5198981.1 cyclase family protein [Fictibacillus enclensis]